MSISAPYDKEFNITWAELAPSLQTLFLTLQSEMTTLQRNYTVLINTLDQLQIQVNKNTNNISINAQEIIIIKQSLATCQGQIEAILELLEGVDWDKLEDLSKLKLDMEQALMDINQLFRRMRMVEVKSENNFNDIADLRADVDNNTEWLNWLSKLTEDIPQMRADIDNNTEWLQYLDRLSEEIPDLRTDVDNNTEWLSMLNREFETVFNEIPDLRTDMDHLTEWMSKIQKDMDSILDPLVDMQIDVDNNVVWMQYIHDRMEGFIDEIVNLRIDIDLVTEWYQKLMDFMKDAEFMDPEVIKNLIYDMADLRIDVDNNTEWISWISKLAEDIPDMRTDIDNNTEWLNWVARLAEDIPDMRTDIDNNTEWLQWLDDLTQEIPDLRTDTDNNTEWLSRLDRLIDDVADNTADILKNIEDIHTNRINIEKNTWAIELNREDIDLNTELIDALPDKILKKVMDYIDSIRFLNLAPKINFNQEDIIEITPYFYMNNMIKFVMTSDLDNNEVIYFIANDGVSTTDYDLYCGFRSNDLRKFYYGNKSLDPMCLRDSSGNKVSHITDILVGDNDYLIVYATYGPVSPNNGWYLIHTGSDRNPGSWTKCKNLNAIWSSNVVGAKYFEDYDTLILFSRDPNYSDLKEQRIAVMRVYQYSTLSFIEAHDIIHPFQILTCNTRTTSFDINRVEGRFVSGDVGDQGYGIDYIVPDSGYLVNNFRMLFSLYEEQDLLVMELFNVNLLYTPASKAVSGNTSFEAPHCYMKLTFDCPKSIVEGSTGAALTCLQNVGDLVFDCEDKNSDFFTKDLDTSYASVSYANIKDITYRNWHVFENYYSWFNRYKNEEQRPDTVTDMMEYGTIEPYTIEEPLITPDAAPWGKWLYKYTMAWDRFFINCSSAQDENIVTMVKSWVRDQLDSTALLPMAGDYFQVDPIKVFTEFGSSSCKMQNGDPRYFYTEYTGSQLIVHEYSYTETSTSFDVSSRVIKTVNVSQSSWLSAASTINHPTFSPNTTSVFYNAISDDFVVFFIDDTKDATVWDYSDYGFLATVKSNGSMTKVFNNISSSYSTNWVTLSNSIQLQKNAFHVTPRMKNMTFTSATNACCCYFYNSDSNEYEDYTHVILTFNAAKNSMTMTNGFEYIEKQYVSKIGRGVGVIYSGPEYGLTFSGQKLDHTFTSFLTQKKIDYIPWGANFSENNFLTGSYNTYKIQLRSSIGLIAYIPNVALFLGGYFSQLENPIPVVLFPECKNYVYMERDPETLEIVAYASKKRFMKEGAKTFNKICIARITTNSDSIIGMVYYRINIGYNDYTF